MATLKTNYKDDMFSGDRKYREIRNSDGTVSFEDVTVYSQTGDVFASADINATNTEVNTINASLTEKVTQKEGNISVEGSTISSTALDWVTWDETNGRMILHKKGTGADAGFPFSSGTKCCFFTPIFAQNNTFYRLYMDYKGNVFWNNTTSEALKNYIEANSDIISSIEFTDRYTITLTTTIDATIYITVSTGPTPYSATVSATAGVPVSITSGSPFTSHYYYYGEAIAIIER